VGKETWFATFMDTWSHSTIGARMGMQLEILMNQNSLRSAKNAMPIVEGIAELLEILIEIDGVIANNTELLEVWYVYMSIIMESGNDSIDDRRVGQRPVSFVMCV